MRTVSVASETNHILLTCSKGIKTGCGYMRALSLRKRRRTPNRRGISNDGSPLTLSLYVNRPHPTETLQTFNFSCTHEHQTSPIDFNSKIYPTLLDSASVQFDVVKGDPSAPKWSNVLVNKDIRIVGSREVRISFRYHPANC